MDANEDYQKLSLISNNQMKVSYSSDIAMPKHIVPIGKGALLLIPGKNGDSSSYWYFGCQKSIGDVIDFKCTQNRMNLQVSGEDFSFALNKKRGSVNLIYFSHKNAEYSRGVNNLGEDATSKIVSINEFTKAVTVVNYDETKSRVDDISFEGDRILVAGISRFQQDLTEV